MTQIGIIGTGRMAVGLGTGWAQAGHTIIFGSRSPEAKADLSEKVSGARIVNARDAVAAADVVVLAMPFASIEPFAQEHAANLRGKLVIDISNPFDRLPDNRIAGAEITANAIGPGARVIAAFKDNFAQTLLAPVDPSGQVRDVHYAGDNGVDKQIVMRLIKDLGFQPVDCGPLKNARILDGLVTLLVEMDRVLAGGNARSSWKFLT